MWPRRWARRQRQGQAGIEHVILFVAAAAALIWMFGYIRSAFAHRMKSGADGVGQGMLYPPAP